MKGKKPNLTSKRTSFILKTSRGSSRVATLLTGDQCCFLLTVSPYRGMLKYLSQFSQPITEGRFTRRPEKIWNRTEETNESQILFTANSTILAQILQLPSRDALGLMDLLLLLCPCLQAWGSNLEVVPASWPNSTPSSSACKEVRKVFCIHVS